jgi:ABC-2 type transport system ATP-binding protein
MLEIKNISKYFGSNLVLDDISFSVKKGKIFGLIGPNGAGKTTTLRIILGILSASSGDIRFNNNSLDQNFSNLTGYLPEERGLYPKSNVVNTLTYLGQLKGLRHSEAINNIEYWFNRLELTEYKKYHVEELSKGNQQKVQFISAILHDPKILILDEPFSGFDPVNQTIFREIIEEKKTDKYIILSTHLMDLAESLCDEIYLINKGRKVISGSLMDVLNSDQNNFYYLTISDNFSEIDTSIFEGISVIKKEHNSIILDLGNQLPSEFLRNYSKRLQIFEFKKINPSLHQIFMSSVGENNIK